MYERIWLKSLCIVSYIHAFVTQDRQTDNGQEARQINTTDFRDRYYPHESKMCEKLKMVCKNSFNNYQSCSVLDKNSSGLSSRT